MTFIQSHLTECILGAYYVFSAAVSAMPDLSATDGKGYQFTFHFAHILSGDWSLYIGSRVTKP